MKNKNNLAILLLAVVGLSPFAGANQSGWSNVQFIFANAFASGNPSGIEIRLSVIDRTGPFVTPLDSSSMSYTVSGPGIGSRTCGMFESLGDFLPVSFFGSPIVRNGWEQTIEFPPCNGNPAATVRAYCPAGSISHSDDDTGRKLTQNDGSHQFSNFREQGYSDSLGSPETHMCSLTFSDSSSVYTAPVDTLRIVDRDIRFK